MANCTQSRQQPQTPESWAAIEPRVRALLGREGLDSPRAWLAAGRRRFLIFGVPPVMRRMLDRVARRRP